MHQHYTNKSITRNRDKHGSLLILVCALLFLVIVIVAFAFNVWKLSLTRENSQALVKEVALRAALKLNANDNISRMNNLVSQSRELVFDSRADYNAIISNQSGNYFYLEQLGRHLLDEARYGAWLTNIGREKLITAQMAELQKTVNSDPALEDRNATISDLEIGYIGCDSGSNVYDDFCDELQNYDLSMKWIDPKTRRFKGNINIKLPGQLDHNLDFKLSPLRLPLPDMDNLQEASLVNVQDFVKTAKLIDDEKPVKKIFCDQIPCAVKLKVRFPVGNKETVANTNPYATDVIVQAVAQVCGGQLAP